MSVIFANNFRSYRRVDFTCKSFYAHRSKAQRPRPADGRGMLRENRQTLPSPYFVWFLDTPSSLSTPTSSSLPCQSFLHWSKASNGLSLSLSPSSWNSTDSPRTHLHSVKPPAPQRPMSFPTSARTASHSKYRRQRGTTSRTLTCARNNSRGGAGTRRRGRGTSMI